MDSVLEPKSAGGTLVTENVEVKELPECHALRAELVRYMAGKHGNMITGLAKELECSLSVVSRYMRFERPMSGSFISLVKQKLKGFNQTCDDALQAMGEARWMK
jgi:hypothetical protein